MAVADTAAAASTGNPYLMAADIGLNALAGIFGGGGQSTAVPKYSDVNTQLRLGDLPSQLGGMDIGQLLQQIQLSQLLGGELMNMPGGLSYQSLSQSPLGGGLFGGIDLANLPQQIGQNVNQAFTSSLDLAGNSLQRNLSYLQDQAQRQAAATKEQILGGLGTMGLRGSTAGGQALGRSLQDINAGLMNTIQTGQEAAQQFASNAAAQRAQGMLAAYGLQGNLAGTMGNLLLNQRGQDIGLRGMMEGNRAALMSDPVFQNLFGLRQATGGQQQISQTQYSEFN